VKTIDLMHIKKSIKMLKHYCLLHVNFGNVDLVKYLVEFRADINTENCDGETLLNAFTEGNVDL